MYSSFLPLSLLAFGGYASAHGYVSSAAINGQNIPGANGPSPSSSSAWRKVSTGDPVTNLQSQDLVCGHDAQLATGTATANPGDAMQIWWVDEGNGNWEHNVGPIQTWMAKCSGDCTSYTPDGSTNWFKISELGQLNPGQQSAWVQANVDSGAPVNLTIPSNLAAGNYLLRHEIIALQNAGTQGLAEFYPACLQLTVGGSQSGTPDSTVHFPGAYSPTDPGILVNVYNGPFTYVFPGGPVSNLKDPLSDTNDDAADPSTASSSSASPAGSGGGSSGSSSSGSSGSGNSNGSSSSGSSGAQAPLSTSSSGSPTSTPSSSSDPSNFPSNVSPSTTPLSQTSSTVSPSTVPHNSAPQASSSSTPVAGTGSGSHSCRISKGSGGAVTKKRRGLSSLASESLALIRQHRMSTHRKRRLIRGMNA